MLRQAPNGNRESYGPNQRHIYVFDMRSKRKLLLKATRYRVNSAFSHLCPDRIIFGLLRKKSDEVCIPKWVRMGADPTAAMPDLGRESEWV